MQGSAGLREDLAMNGVDSVEPRVRVDIDIFACSEGRPVTVMHWRIEYC